MTDTTLKTVTASGLYVMPDGKPRGWSNFTWTQQVADMPGEQEYLDALALIGKDAIGQLGTDRRARFVEPKDVAFACLHDGEIQRAAHIGLDFAAPDVSLQAVAAADQYEQTEWTVCGVLEQTWRTATIPVYAGTPLVAYFRAWEWARDNCGEEVLLAAVHPGFVETVDVFGFADPWARDQESMTAKARDWGLTL